MNEIVKQTMQFSEFSYYSLSESELERLLQHSLGFLDDSKVLNDIGLFPIPEDTEEPLQQYFNSVRSCERVCERPEKDTCIVGGAILNTVRRSA